MTTSLTPGAMLRPRHLLESTSFHASGPWPQCLHCWVALPSQLQHPTREPHQSTLQRCCSRHAVFSRSLVLHSSHAAIVPARVLSACRCFDANLSPSGARQISPLRHMMLSNCISKAARSSVIQVWVCYPSHMLPPCPPSAVFADHAASRRPI